jgi:hypothetical protein
LCFQRSHELVSWWDMEKFSADAFFEISRLLQRFQSAEWFTEEAELHPDSRIILKWLPDLQKECDSIGLRLAAKFIARTLEGLTSGSLTLKEWQNSIPELQHRIRDEMEDKLFMYLPPERAERYDQKELLGNSVNAKFPGIQYDAVEAGNCYACGRSTAVVFHLMRIMEIGVQEFGSKLGVPLVGEKNWQVILDGVNAAIKKLPPKDPKTIEFSEISANLYSVKLAWRNEVMHPKDTYTLEEADNLIQQVKIFMEQLSQII